LTHLVKADYPIYSAVEAGCVQEDPGVRVKGFTLLEVLIALVILSTAFLALLKGNVFNLRSQREAENLTVAVIAAESLMKEIISEGYPESVIEEGEFEEDAFSGFRWKKSIESVEFPYIEELKLVTGEVLWGERGSYELRTVLSNH
jgi:type II secretion system protein I